MNENGSRLTPLSEFLEAAASARYEDYADRPGFRVESPQEFEAMKQHIMQLYEGVRAEHSFVDDNGQVFDCLPAADQPALRGTGETPAAPPVRPERPFQENGSRETRLVKPQLRQDRVDELGNTMACPPGTVAMRRVTLAELTANRNLGESFGKYPGGGGEHPSCGSERAAPHQWAHAYHYTHNLGGRTVLNLWNPQVGDQGFSLSQHWFVGGNQTLESGWQVYPMKYKKSLPVLFIYYTPDGYKSGCYNLDKKAFVLLPGASWTPGMALEPTSVYGRVQCEIEIEWLKCSDKWWMWVNGAAVGYYPTSVYNGGQLTQHATKVDFGGEVVRNSNETWPDMGSGRFPQEGYTKAAYQRQICYVNQENVWENAPVKGNAGSPCYKITIKDPPAGAPDWGEYFFFGGPGGSNC